VGGNATGGGAAKVATALFATAVRPIGRSSLLATAKLADIEALAARLEAMKELLRKALECGCVPPRCLRAAVPRAMRSSVLVTDVTQIACCAAPSHGHRNSNIAAEVRDTVHQASISATKRFAAITVALVVLVTTVPASAMCCAGQSKTTAMSSMACCTETCTMSAPDSTRDHDATLIPAPAPQPITTAATALIAPINVASTVRATVVITESSPPPFLSNAQFRI
jgi:hypothetical protein